MNLSKVTLGMLLSVALAACGGAEPEVKYPEPPQPVGETHGPMQPQAQQGQEQQLVGAEGSQQLTVQNAQAAEGDQVGQQGGDLAIGTDDSGYTETDPAALQDFKEPLAPYGNWVEDASYGTVWVPRTEVVGADFAPYVSSGHWTYDEDYVWVSDYDWGWAPFHYGRWVWVGGRGWAWIPGRQYSGAWVVWRTGGYGYGYVGWAPAPPSWYWYGGYAVGVGYYHPVPYVFCGRGDLFHPAVAGHIVTGPAVAQIGAATRPYSPATPSVGSGHTPANPTVGGTVGGRTAASPSVGSHGPNPQNELGIANAPRSPQGNAQLTKAQAFASPHTAVPMGAHPPSMMPRMATNPGVTRTPSPSPSQGQGNLPPRLRPTASAPQYTGLPSSSSRQSATIGRPDPGSSQPRTQAPAYTQRWSSPSPSQGGSYGSSGRSYSPPQQVHSSPSYSAPSHPSTPSYSAASPSHSYSAPSMGHSYTAPPSSHTYSAPSGGHSTGGGSRGGGRGGHR